VLRELLRARGPVVAALLAPCHEAL
jgi:hypothetical protein